LRLLAIRVLLPVLILLAAKQLLSHAESIELS